MTKERREIRYEGIHCNLLIEQFPNRVVVLRISGTDVGEFGKSPMTALNDWVNSPGPIDLFIDARNVRGASIEVSGEWAGWLDANKKALRSVTMLTGSRYIQVTAQFVRRFANLEGIMRICTEPVVFDQTLAEAVAGRSSD
ncbi:MAG TPA: hypothetical protein VG273_14785 [Bryobacteraceae bacterium]|jgi:hypothetical protein|nr:hypothetical protein [Bryobacteraceae bacterium]